MQNQLIQQAPNQQTLNRTQKRQLKSRKHQRTVEYETAVKSAIMDDVVLRQLNEDIIALQQKRFDNLIKEGKIVPVDMSFIFQPTYGINWITT